MEISSDLELTADDREVLAFVRLALFEADAPLLPMEIWQTLYEKKHISFWRLRDILATGARTGDGILVSPPSRYCLSDKARSALAIRT